MNRLAIGMLAALAAGLGQAAVTVGTGKKVSAAAEDYVLEGGTLVFETPGQAFGGSISGYGEVVNATGVPVGMSGATLSADGGTLVLKGTRTVKARWIRFTSLATRPDDPMFSNQGPQLGEIELILNGVVVPYSGHTVTCTSGETSYAAAAVFDNNNANKAFINVGSGTKPVVFTVNLGAETEFDAYRFYVGNDCPGRDPISFTFEVSSDGQDWTLLHSATDYRPTMRDACLRYSPTENFTLVPRTAFCSGNPAVTVAALAELDLVDTVLEIASGSVDGALRLVDGEATISGTATFSGAAFGDGELVLDRVAASGTLGTTLKRTCRFVRFTVTRDRGNGVANNNLEGWAMSRLNLTLDGTRVAYPAGSTVTLHSRDANMNSSKTAEAQSLLTDDNSATFFNLEAATPIMIAMPEPVTFDGYNWWSRGDMPCRDPRSWIFEVSEDGEKWVTLETVIDCPYRELEASSSELRNAEIYSKTFVEPRLSVAFRNGGSFSGEYVYSGRVEREDGVSYDYENTGNGIVYSPDGTLEFSSEAELPGKNFRLNGGTLRYVGAGSLVLDGYSFAASSGETTLEMGNATLANSAISVADGAALAIQGQDAVVARYYRFTSLETRKSGDYAGTGPAVGEIGLLRNGLDIVYRNASVTCSFPNSSSPGNIADNNVQNKDFAQVNSSTTPVAWTVDMGEATEFDAYRWLSADQNGRDPSTWTLEASLDGNTWTLIDSQTDYRADDPLARWVWSDIFEVAHIRTAFGADTSVSVAEGGKLSIKTAGATFSGAAVEGEVETANAEVTISGPDGFEGRLSGAGTVWFDGAKMDGTAAATAVQRCRYYRFTSLRTRPHGTYQGQGPQIGEIQLLRNGAVVPYEGAVATGYPMPTSFDAAPLVDNNTYPGNKVFWNVSSATVHVAFTVDLGKVVEFDGYNWWSGNDGTGRDPYSWTFETSEDGVNWTLVDFVEAHDIELTGDSDNTTLRSAKIYEKTFFGLSSNLLADAPVELGAGGELVLDGVVETVGTLSGAGTVTLSNGATLVVCPSEGNRELFSGEISGSGTLVVRGGTLRWRKATFGEGVKIVLQDGGRIVEAPTGFAVFVR